ncbi:hypothetical protein I4U23_015218 [Adineta vaga]|nr:hypothetical protein I4U23_015218 [Adineta vaga]
MSVIIQSIETNLCRYIGPFLLFIGTIGCLLNILVFSRKSLRKNPCSFYLIAYNIADLLYIYCALLFLIISIGYQIDPTTVNLIFCRLRLYTALLFHGLSQFYLILASIDRVLITSRHALTRRRSNRRLAFISIAIGTLFWIIFHSHTLIFSDIIEMAPHSFVCFFRLGIEADFVDYYTIIKETLMLSLMIICGLCSIHNIRSIHHIQVVPKELIRRQIPLNENHHSSSSKDRQLVFMLIGDITTYTFFSFIFGIFVLYTQITKNDSKKFEHIQIENSLRNICLFSINIPCCISCYVNLFISKTFRNEMKKIFVRN